MRWLYHYIKWKFFRGRWWDHQCLHAKVIKDAQNIPFTLYCTRCRDHYGEHSFTPREMRYDLH